MRLSVKVTKPLKRLAALRDAPTTPLKQGVNEIAPHSNHPNIASLLRQRWPSNPRPLLQLAGLFVALTLLALGCSRNPGPPPPLPAEQIAPEMQKAFAKAGTEVKDLIGEIERALQSKDYTAAYQRLQMISRMPDSTPEQRMITARASLTLTALLQAAEAQGDEKAATALKLQRSSR